MKLSPGNQAMAQFITDTTISSSSLMTSVAVPTTSSNRSKILYVICSALNNQYSLRIKLQKVEFCICWLLFFANALCVGRTVGAMVSTSFLSFTLFYVQASIFSRVIAYLFDFSRAFVTTNSIPEWLKLHHGGVLLHHTMCYIMVGGSSDICLDNCYNDINNGIEMMQICNGSLRLRLIVYLLILQATHNTWTKRLSLVFYWVNCFGIGVTCSIANLVISPFMMEDHIVNNDTEIVVPIAIVVYALQVVSLSITVLGMLKLVGSCKGRV